MRSEFDTLRLVHPGELPTKVSAQAGVAVAFEIADGRLGAKFQVRGVPVHANPTIEKGVSHWGLWDWDVVELFVSASGDPDHYFEFQVSPLGQYFELEVHEPRVRVNRDYRSGVTVAARQLGRDSWDAELWVPLDSLGSRKGQPIDVKQLRGNAFAILSKTYWSLHLPPQEKPDFHLPQYFKPIFR